MNQGLLKHLSHTRLLLLFLLFSAFPTIIFSQTTEDSITIKQAVWHKKKVTGGVFAYWASFDSLYGCRQQIFVIEVENRHRKFSVKTYNGRELTSIQARTSGVAAAVNGTYFDMGGSNKSVCFVAHNGRVVDYVKSEQSLMNNGAVIFIGKKTQILPWDVNKEDSYMSECGLDKLKADIMVSGPLLLLDGKAPHFDSVSHNMMKHPRSGIAKKGNRTYLFVVDGRHPERAGGVTIPEFSHLMRILGMQSALNLDGGGSSILWAEPNMMNSKEHSVLPTEAGILNKPSGSVERAVSNSIFVK